MPKCSACLDEIGSDEEGIQCAQGHSLCSAGCSRRFIDNVLEEPLLSIPMKCPTCKTLLDDAVTQRVMTPEQTDRYQYDVLQLSASKKAYDGEVFCVCPFCEYFEYRTAEENDVLFVYCQEPSCMKVSCFVCKVSVNLDNETETNFHIKCSSMQQFKNEFERILLSGNTVSCPKCKLPGMKDYDCAHICCPNCKTDWCYVCGKSLANLNLANDLYSHFENWEANENRCPMYLRNISAINRDFPFDDIAALQKFHEYRSKLLLKEFVERIGGANFEDLVNHFESVRNCGFSSQDIRDAKGWRRTPQGKSATGDLETTTRNFATFYWIILIAICVCAVLVPIMIGNINTTR